MVVVAPELDEEERIVDVVVAVTVASFGEGAVMAALLLALEGFLLAVAEFTMVVELVPALVLEVVVAAVETVRLLLLWLVLVVAAVAVLLVAVRD
jgi:hypothetical protein